METVRPYNDAVMSVDLRERLRRVLGPTRSSAPEAVAERIEERAAHTRHARGAQLARERDVQHLVPGTVLEGPLGTCFVAERELALDHRHGDEALGRFFELSDRGLGCLARLVEPLAIDRESILFLDTETTGLAGGTGTYVFMVGLAYFRGDRLLVRQYFMRDHAEEPAMLAALEPGVRAPRGRRHVQRQVVRRAAAADALHRQPPAADPSPPRSTWTCSTRPGGSGASSWNRARSARWSGRCSGTAAGTTCRRG